MCIKKAFLGKIYISFHISLQLVQTKPRNESGHQSTMATARDPAPVKQMETLLECSICNCTETITQPRTLSCLNSIRFANTVWRLILLRLTARKQSKQKPKYQRSLNVQYAELNFTSKKAKALRKCHQTTSSTTNRLELLTLQQQSQRIKCQSCKAQEPATSRCISCENYLCEKCLAAHNNFPALSDHVVLTLEELAKPENRAKAKGKPRCEKHDKVLMFYCETCKVLVCRYCVDVSHPRPEHMFIPLADIVVQHKKTLKTSSSIFEQQMNEAIQSNLKIEHAMETLKNNKAKAKDAIMHKQQEILNALTKLLEKKTAALFNAVDNKYNEANKPLMKQQADVKDYLEKAKSSLDFAKNIISNGSDEEILSLKHQVEDKAESIEKERPELMKPVHNGAIEYQAEQYKIE